MASFTDQREECAPVHVDEGLHLDDVAAGVLESHQHRLAAATPAEGEVPGGRLVALPVRPEAEAIFLIV